MIKKKLAIQLYKLWVFIKRDSNNLYNYNELYTIETLSKYKHLKEDNEKRN